MSSNPQPQWAVLPADGDEVYSSRESAEKCLAFLLEGNIDYCLYEIREVRPQASSAERSEESLVSAIAESLRAGMELHKVAAAVLAAHGQVCGD